MRIPFKSIPITSVEPNFYTFHWNEPESDGTLQWSKTSVVVVHVRAGGQTGVGWTYSARAANDIVKERLADLVIGESAFATTRIWEKMIREVRNFGQPGIIASAISAIDNALWDLKARLLSLPLVTLLGTYRDSVETYWSAGFTSYSRRQLEREFYEQWARGFRKFKMKVGRHPEQDAARVHAARKAIGKDAELFTDANGAYSRKQALEMAWRFYSESSITWFEEPVSANDLEGLHLLRDRSPPGVAIASGEYGYDLHYFEELLSRECVDVLQIDVSRCGGVTAFLRAAGLAQARNLPISTHTTPTQHVHVCAALPNVQHIEYFKDHALIENILFDGVLIPEKGHLKPDITRSGNGLELKRADAERFAA